MSELEYRHCVCVCGQAFSGPSSHMFGQLLQPEGDAPTCNHGNTRSRETDPLADLLHGHLLQVGLLQQTLHRLLQLLVARPLLHHLDQRLVVVRAVLRCTTTSRRKTHEEEEQEIYSQVSDIIVLTVEVAPKHAVANSLGTKLTHILTNQDVLDEPG